MDAMVQPKRLALVPVQEITRAILILRGQRVLLDGELRPLRSADPRFDPSSAT